MRLEDASCIYLLTWPLASLLDLLFKTCRRKISTPFLPLNHYIAIKNA
jgi:hypothetical protein